MAGPQGPGGSVPGPTRARADHRLCRAQRAVERAGGATQTAYRIVAAASPEQLATDDVLWDTGKIASSHTAQIVYDGVGSPDKTLRWLENSGHNLLVDGEREAVWAESYEWMMARATSKGK